MTIDGCKYRGAGKGSVIAGGYVNMCVRVMKSFCDTKIGQVYHAGGILSTGQNVGGFYIMVNIVA